MNPIASFKSWLRIGSEEEPLFSLPAEGDSIELDEDEQTAVESSLREFYDNEIEAIDNKKYQWASDGRLVDFLSELRKQNKSNTEADEETDLLHTALWTETKFYYYMKGLKHASYSRYGDGKLVAAAQSCFKALAKLASFQSSAVYSGDGVAELWFVLSHMHACCGRFKVAKKMLDAARTAAKQDRAIIRDSSIPSHYGISGSRWEAITRSLEQRIKSKMPPSPIANLSQAEPSRSWVDARDQSRTPQDKNPG